MDGHSGFFHLFAMVNNAAMNLGVQISVQVANISSTNVREMPAQLDSFLGEGKEIRRNGAGPVWPNLV